MPPLKKVVIAEASAGGLATALLLADTALTETALEREIAQLCP